MAELDIADFAQKAEPDLGDFLIGVDSTRTGFKVPQTQYLSQEFGSGVQSAMSTLKGLIDNTNENLQSLEGAIKSSQNTGWTDISSSYLSTVKYRVFNGVVYITFSGTNVSANAMIPDALFAIPAGIRPSIAMAFSATFTSLGGTNRNISYSLPVQVIPSGLVQVSVDWRTAMWNAANMLLGFISYPI